jgi:penicillin-binding protein 1A
MLLLFSCLYKNSKAKALFLSNKIKQLLSMRFLASGKYLSWIKFIYKFSVGSFVFFILFLLALNFNFLWLFGKMPTVDDLENPKSELASEILSADNKVLGKFFYENRSLVSFNELPENLINALIATEDVRFTKHSGIDARSTLRVIAGLMTLDRKGGGSTLSQQLAKNLYNLRKDEDFTGPIYKIPGLNFLVIKAKEWITATKLESRYTKQEIMTMYLNTIEFSSGAYGIKAAAKTYFKKSPKELNQEEAALLVGMIQNPTRFNPKFKPENAKARRNIVLSQMVKAGVLDQERAEVLADKNIKLNYSVESHNQGSAQYFRQHVKDLAKKELKDLGFEEEDLYTKGFRIFTTIDSRMQTYAEESVNAHMKDQQAKFYSHWKGRNPWVQRASENSSSYVEIPGFIENIAKRTPQYQSLKEQLGNDHKLIISKMKEKVPMRIFTWNGERDTLMSPLDSLKHYKKFLNIGMLSMDPLNGHIKAWVGGINFKHFKFDNVYQSKRQPGSTFKPFVYLTALEGGFTTCETIVDEPVSIDGWTPKNSDGKYSYQSLTLKQALGQSINSVSARLIKEFGPAAVVEKAHEMGIKSDLVKMPSLCLGVSEVTLYELLASYSVFVNEGKYSEPQVLLRIEDKDGNVLRDYHSDQKEVLSKESAYKMVHLMRGATGPGGTALGLSRYGVLDGNEIAAKTGTTSNYSDGWFMGMTQNLIAGVWVGGEDRAVHFRSIDLGQGARVAMPAWGMFMQKVYADPSLEYKKARFKIPGGVRIINDCVLSPNEGFPQPSIETQIEGQPALKPKDEEEQL